MANINVVTQENCGEKCKCSHSGNEINISLCHTKTVQSTFKLDENEDICKKDTPERTGRKKLSTANSYDEQKRIYCKSTIIFYSFFFLSEKLYIRDTRGNNFTRDFGYIVLIMMKNYM